jgi:hypothetical protein
VVEAEALGELTRVVRPGGAIVLVVPAYRWLLDRKHHRAVRAGRRYTRGDVRMLCTRLPVDVIRLTHLFFTLFPAIASYRVLQRIFHPRPGPRPTSDVGPVHPALNAALKGIVGCEQRWLRISDFPAGSSILAVLRRKPS